MHSSNPPLFALTFSLRISFILAFVFMLSSCNGQQAHTTTISLVGKKGSLYPKEASDFSKGVYCGFMDSKGDLWFGSNGNGLYRYDGSTMLHYTESEGLSNNQVCAITEDREGNLWFGTAKGLSRYNGKKFLSLAILQSDTSSIWLDKVYPVVNPNQVMALCEDVEGNLWIGTNGADVYRYDGKTFTRYLSELGMVYEDGKQHNIVLSITEDLSGNLWFTSLSHGGVSRFDGENFTHFMPIDGLSDDFVRTSFCDRAGDIWIGTHGNRNGGLDRFDGESFTQFHKTDDGFYHNNVLCITEDRSGKLWLGSGTSSLATFDGKHFHEFKSPAGETFDLILCLVEDQNGDMWFGGGQGLWKYDGAKVFDMTQAKNW